MGCSSSIETLYHPSKQWKQSPIGLLSVTIVSFSLNNSNNFFFTKQNPHAKLTVSNQTFYTKKDVQAQADRQTSVNQKFQFTINSCYQANGRSLDCQVWSDTFFVGGRIGHGKIDLDNIINNQLDNEVICQIYQGQEIRGNIKIRICFTPFHYDNLSFKFINALVIHKRGQDLSKRKIYVRVQIGQEILQTKPCEESPKVLPHWQNQTFNFKIPTFCQTGKITVYKSTIDSDIQLGNIELNIPNLLQTKAQRMFDQIFSLFVAEKQQVKGTLKFYTLKGSSHFVEPPSPRKRFSKNPQQLYNIPIIQPDLNRIQSVNIDQKIKRYREEIKNRLLSPLPSLKKKNTNIQCQIKLNKVQVQNPQSQ